MNSWIPNNKIVKLAAATAVLSVLLYFIGLFIIYGEIRKVENLYNDTNSELFKEQKFWAIKSIAGANKESIEILRNFFVQKGDEVKFIEEIEKVARTSSVKFEIASIDVKTDQESSLKEDINVKMKAEGLWKNMFYFIDKLKKMPFGVKIDRVNLDADSYGNWSGSIDFVVFREK